MIRLGICTDFENAAMMKEIGYDYLELNLTKLARMSEEEYDRLLAKSKASPLPAEAANCMVPGDFCLCSEEGCGQRIREYLAVAFARAEETGIQVIVFGSGAARKLPEGVSVQQGMDYLAEFLKLAGGMAAQWGIRIAIEPLNRAECNFINTVAQAQELAAYTCAPNVSALADLYHMMKDGEAYDALDNGVGVIHTHIAERASRAYPRRGDGSDADYEEFFRRLKNAGYEGRVSVEGQCKDFAADAKAAFELLDGLRR